MKREKTFLIFEFIGDKLDSCITTGGYLSREDLLRDIPRYANDWLPTKIVVRPKKGHRRNPITHALAGKTEKASTTRFVDIIERSQFEARCRTADDRWENEKSIIRERIRLIEQSRSQLPFEKLPQNIQPRIKRDTSGCWLWISHIPRKSLWRPEKLKRVQKRKYGRLKFQGKPWFAHRLVFTLLVGPIPEGIVLLHKCDTPACVNPAHIRMGIDDDNVQDMISKYRAAWQRMP